MGSEEELFTSRIQSRIQTDWDFQKRLKQRLVQESSKVDNPFNLIVGLFYKGVLSDDDSSEANTYSVMTQIIVQLVMMLACSKGAAAISSLKDELEATGNLRLASAIRTWIEGDFAAGVDGPLTSTQAMGNSFVETGDILIENMISHMKNELVKHFGGESDGNTFTTLVNTEGQTTVPDAQVANTAIASSSTAIASLTLASPNRNNKRTLEQIHETLSVRKRNDNPISVGSQQVLAIQQTHEASNVGTSSFFKQTVCSDTLSILNYLKCQYKSAIKGISQVRFDTKKLMASYNDGSLNLWNLEAGNEFPITIAANVNITCFQYDVEILIMGTSQGTVHLFDAKTYEEKSQIGLGEDPVTSLKFVGSTLLITTRRVDQDSMWWVDISLPDMKIVLRRSGDCYTRLKNKITGVFMCTDYSFVYSDKLVNIYDTELGSLRSPPCYLMAPAIMRTLNVCDFPNRKRVVVAGCQNGMIALWNTCTLRSGQRPFNAFKGDDQAIISLCSFNEHLLSLDHSGKLLMWSGHHLENKDIKPAPRTLLINENSTNLTAHGSRFAVYFSTDETINIWTVPDLWLRTG